MNDELTPEPTQPSDDSTHPAAAAEQADAAGGASAPVPAAAEPADRSTPDAAPQSAFGPPSAGGMLRIARQAQGIDLASLAAMLKIPLRRLEALENGRHEELQGPTFERALAQAACRVLKIDAKPVLALLPQHEGNTLERVSEGINTPFRDGHGSGGFELPSLLMRPAVIGVVLLIVAAIVVFSMPDSWQARVTRVFSGGVAASAPAPSASAAASAAAPGTTTTTVELPGASAAAPVAAPPPLSAASVSATAAQDVDDVLAHVAGAPNIPLQVTATADSWVEVVDAQGHSLLSRTVVAGESVGLDGALPMRVKIGNAAGTHLKLRGDNVDLTPWTRDNVARLELK